MVRRRRKKTASRWDVLISLPWQVSVGLAIVVGVFLFVGLNWVLPALLGANPYLQAGASALSSMAWGVSGLLLLLALFLRAIQQRGATSPVAIRRKAGRKSTPGDWRAPALAPPARPLQQASKAPAAARPTIPEPLQATIDNQAWSLELLRQIEWKRFEDLCQKYYASKGIKSETTPLGADGGIDLRLYQDDSENASAVVQCKAWGTRFVGVKEVRELLGVITHERIAKGFFMTSGRFSDEAKAVSASNPITLIDGAMFLMMIQRLPPQAQKDLLDFATDGDYETPTCPSCGVKMKSVAGKAGRPDFWGCPSFPRCRQRLGMPRIRGRSDAGSRTSVQSRARRCEEISAFTVSSAPS